MPGSKLVFRNAENAVFVSFIAGCGGAVLSMNVAGSTRLIGWIDVLHSPPRKRGCLGKGKRSII